jgi:hypothetical protein
MEIGREEASGGTREIDESEGTAGAERAEHRGAI